MWKTIFSLCLRRASAAVHGDVVINLVGERKKNDAIVYVCPCARLLCLWAVLHPKHRKPLGEAIRNQRKKLGLNQAELAEKAELSTVFISEVERGIKTISVDALVRIAKALQVPPKDLFEGI